MARNEAREGCGGSLCVASNAGTRRAGYRAVQAVLGGSQFAFGVDPRTAAHTVTASELAHLLGVDEAVIRRDLVSRGLVVRVGKRYDLIESVRAYCAHMRAVAAGRGGADGVTNLAAERARLAREQAEGQAMRNAQLRAALLDAGEVTREWSEVLRTVRASVLAVASRVRSQLPHLTPHDAVVIDRELRQALATIAYDGDS